MFHIPQSETIGIDQHCANFSARAWRQALLCCCALFWLPPYAAHADTTASDATADGIQQRIDQTRIDDDPGERGRHLFALAQLRRQQGQLDDAHALLVEAAAFQREARTHAARAHTALSLSLVLKQLGRLRSAEDAARDALVLDSDLDIVRGALNQLEQISLAYQGRNEWQEAARVDNDVAFLREQVVPELVRVADYLALARASLDGGAFDRVNELCHDVLTLSEPHDAWRQSAEAFELLGHALKGQDKGVLAIERYRDGVQFARRCGECALLARLQDHVTDVADGSTLILRKPAQAVRDAENEPRFKPLP